MRAAPLLLLLLPSALGAAPAPVLPPVLLVLRSACGRPEQAYFSAAALRGHALASNRSAPPRDVRILSYNETCGARWRAAVLRGVWGARAAGGAAALAGRPDAALCGAWGPGPAPGGCARAPARAAALVQLAARLGWRRALLPARGPCAPDALAAARALAAAGLAVRRRAPSAGELARRPHVVVLCSTDVRGVRRMHVAHSSAQAPASGAGAAPVLLILHLASVGAIDSTTSEMKNYSSILELLSSTLEGDSREVDVNDGTQAAPLGPLDRSSLSNESIDSFKLSQDSYGEREQPGRAAASGGPLGTLLLADEDLEENPKLRTPDTIYNEALDALERFAAAAATRTERAREIFFLYESTGGVESKPSLVAKLVTDSERALGDAEEWSTVVKVVDSGGDFRRWGAGGDERSESAERSSATGAAGALVACGATALLVLLVLLAGGALAYGRARRRRGPGAGPVLSAADFAFPVDECRVGEGMESMVSWLQELHGCNAPGRAGGAGGALVDEAGEPPDRPDLLRRAAGHTLRAASPSAPSAPSSTCSVTRLAPDRRTRYKGDPVHVKYLPAGALQLRRQALDVLLVMQALRHENINPFLGCLADARPALVFEACGRGSLEDVLVADDIRLDWTFRLSLLTDLARGMRYLHASPLRAHGQLSSRNCVVDARWVLRVTDCGAAQFARAQGLPRPQRRARELLWTAPELLRERRAGGTQPGDAFSFGIIMQEVIVRGEPYCMLQLTPEEIVEKLRRPPPLVRPSVSMGAAPPEAVRLMRQCWSEAPDLRPDFARVYELFRHMHRGRKINIVDSMFEMLEKYSNNLEELIKERTEQLDMEKKKTEQLLNRMLPRSVAERLMMGSRVEPEEFEEVSIYFSDIVGFTELAARSTPVQVVDLLNDLYTTFDAAIEQYRVYKVETIGDAYMVVGGLPTRARDHAESVATMALHLLHLAGRFRVRHLPNTPLHLRIGLHTGPCCAAVVGLTMPRYCLFGDTVNTASRMESTGAAWRVQVSAATAERLAAAGGYRLRSRGLRQIKGKGVMHTYWLLGKDGFDKPLPAPPPLQSEEVLFESDGELESERSDEDPTPRATAPPAHRAPAPRAPRPRALSDADYDCVASAAVRGPRAERAGWARSGAVSADSSPPRAAHARYRCLAGSARALRRQWSLERGDELAAAAARAEPLAELLAEPLALRVPPPRAPARYRTRPAPPDDSRLP